MNTTINQQQVWFYAGKYDSLKLSVDGGDSLRYDWKPNLSNGEGGLGIRHEVFTNGCGAYFTNGSLTRGYLGFTLTFYNDSLSCETRIEQPK